MHSHGSKLTRALKRRAPVAVIALLAWSFLSAPTAEPDQKAACGAFIAEVRGTDALEARAEPVIRPRIRQMRAEALSGQDDSANAGHRFARLDDTELKQPGAEGEAAPAAASPHCFAIEVVDEQTGRGVPLVELRTVNDIRYYTDSNGLIAFHEPGLMDHEVFFYVSSHGYEFPADGFGFRGVRLHTTPGRSARVKVRRLNLAERIYRVTGQGIYRDTILLGRPAPLRHPVLNGRVLGQDGAQATVYRGRICWFWGDTARESYPLGQFAASGATSELPGRGGLDPSVGVDLTYFVDEEGFSRKMAPLPDPGLVWLDGLTTVNDDAGRERLIAHYSRMKSLGERLEHGLVVFNDETQTFERLTQFDLNASAAPGGHALKVKLGTVDYLYFAQPYPFVRVKADWRHVTDPCAYDAFTCLAPGRQYDPESPKLDRGPDGRLVWSWKTNAPVLDIARQRELMDRGHIRNDEAWIDLRDVETRKSIQAHAASVRWNEFRHRYVMICQEIYGSPSFLGEIWYAEAEAPEGPWRRARKIVSHSDYSFYNPCHHAFFDQDGGRLIYFEATYTAEFSGAKDRTAGYNYNQIMYRLDLGDPRLRMPQSEA